MNDLQKDGVMSDWNQISALQVAAELREFIEKEALPGTGIDNVQRSGGNWPLKG
jgi:malate synthase